MPRAKKPTREIEVSPAQIKILSDPTRLRILTMLFERENTISGLAKALGLTPATVHHHIGVLRGAGLIEPTRLEIHGNLVEKYYKMPAKDIETATAWAQLRDGDKVAYRLAVFGMLKGMINDAMKAIQERGTVEWEAGRLFFYRIPWRRDVLLEVQAIFEEARAKLERLQELGREEGGREMLAILTTLPT
ncbi:MAG TPA: winged helix-turn-helix domain-containing protein [Thermoplasmata archaeon]|jgi:DNA-binding transcriptional ArsR family regulator|nr:winged helix-turn-helix domain-containing protein [Thermoplasmata archaeon]